MKILDYLPAWMLPYLCEVCGRRSWSKGGTIAGMANVCTKCAEKIQGDHK